MGSLLDVCDPGPWDELLSYYTSKYVQIRNWRLGIFYWIQLFCIFCYIVLWLIFYRGDHLAPNDVTGVVNLRLQHPTQHCNPLHKGCKADFTPLTKLPYCDVYKSTSTDEAAPAKQLECQVKDNVNISVSVTHAPGVLFLPTRYSFFSQAMDCEPSSENGYWCENIFSFTEDSKERSFFLADAERFTLLVDHSFQSVSRSTGSLVERGKAKNFRGTIEPDVNEWAKLGGGHAGVIVPSHDALADETIPDVSETRLKEFPSVFKIPLGDILSLADLLKLADPRGEALLDIGRQNGETMRWAGAVLVINIEYSNFCHWDPLAHCPIQYALSASLAPTQEYKKMHSWSTDGGREINDVHGFLISATVRGRIYTFEFQALLQVLTTSLTLFAIASIISDFFMVYVLELRAKYCVLKYQPSQNFSRLIQIMEKLDHKKKTDFGNLERSGSQYPHLKILSDAVESGDPPDGRELLHLLCKTEERLNLLDGMDASLTHTHYSINDRIFNFIEDFERRHWKQSHSVVLSPDRGSFLTFSLSSDANE